MHYASQRALFLQHVAQTSPAPLAIEIESASDCWLHDVSGKKYLDLIAGIGPSVLGHRHPRVLEAVQRQTNQYWHTLVYGEYVLAPQVKLAERLASVLPGLDSVYFVNSGAEATEGAMKLAKRATGRPHFVACRNAYHGSTQGAASLMSPDDFTRAFLPLLPGVYHINFNETDDFGVIDDRVAAVIVETVQGEAGVIPPDAGWLSALRQRCDETGALLVLDEIQAGMGRTGTLFAFEQYGIVPDILLLAKGLGGGMPLGAFIARRELMQLLTHDPVLGHITTFGGHPVCCAAGLAALQFLLDEQLMKSVADKSRLFQSLLVHPMIKEVRSAGLLIAVEFDSFDTNKKIIDRCIEKGVFTDWFLFASQCMRIAPPLIMNEEEIHSACAIILECCDTF
jgi:acetylornithine/succinyldiaminopimelate/putrescine aminotransferase